MKTTLNLATPPSRRERYGFAWAVPTALVGFALLIWMSLSTWHTLVNYRAVRRSLEGVSAHDQDLKSKIGAIEHELRKPESAQLFRETRFVNRLIAQRQFGVTDLTERTSRLMPADARLVSLTIGQWDPEKGSPSVKFAVEAKDEKSAEQFLTSLENSPDFSDVVVRDQGQEEDQSSPDSDSETKPTSGGGRVMLICTATYAPAQPEAPK